MRYTWRIIITSILLISNVISVTILEHITIMAIITYMVNLAFGWVLGYQIDKYRFSKKELGFAKTTLVDYSHALDSVPIGIGITNEHGQFEFINEAHAKLYGYTKEEFMKKSWQDCYSEEMVDYLNNVAMKHFIQYGRSEERRVGKVCER